MKLGIDMIPVLLPDMTSSVVSGVLSLLYTCKLGQADSQLDQTIDVVRQLPPDLSLSVGGGSDGCLVLEASLEDINTTAVTNILDTVVKYQGLEEPEQSQLFHVGYHKSGQTETMIKWTKSKPNPSVFPDSGVGE